MRVVDAFWSRDELWDLRRERGERVVERSAEREAELGRGELAAAPAGSVFQDHHPAGPGLGCHSAWMTRSSTRRTAAKPLGRQPFYRRCYRTERIPSDARAANVAKGGLMGRTSSSSFVIAPRRGGRRFESD
jgi:hypothetical protein